MVWRREDENPLLPSLLDIARELAGKDAFDH